MLKSNGREKEYPELNTRTLLLMEVNLLVGGQRLFNEALEVRFQQEGAQPLSKSPRVPSDRISRENLWNQSGLAVLKLEIHLIAPREDEVFR
jgi:hypothetical protein